MTHDNLPGAEPIATEGQFSQLRAALSGEAAR